MVSLAAAGIWIAPKMSLGAFAASSSSGQNLLSSAAPATLMYLKTSGTSDSLQPPATLDLTTTAPTLTTLYNYDTARDTAPGLLIAKGTGLGLEEILPTAIQMDDADPVTDCTDRKRKGEAVDRHEGLQPHKGRKHYRRTIRLQQRRPRVRPTGKFSDRDKPGQLERRKQHLGRKRL